MAGLHKAGTARMTATRRRELVPDDRAPAQARRFVAGVVGARHPRLDDAILLTSELVTNSVEHSRSRRMGVAITVIVTLSGQALRVCVIDAGSATWGNHEESDTLMEAGRGLRLVARLARNWGRYPLQSAPEGRVVWFELAQPESR
ncbi:ATP-binding protein [Thermocatellispora tengchongensis]